MTTRLPAYGPRPGALWRDLSDYEAFRTGADTGTGEFPPGASEPPTGPSRREFLKLGAASFALAGLAGCWTQPTEHIVPYIEQPTGAPPGSALWFATAIPVCGTARPVLARSNEGRPTKLEGNPQHPESLGATDTITQAAIYELYDPDRSQGVVHLGDASAWDLFVADIARTLDRKRATGGAGLRFLVEPLTSPFLAAQLDRFFERFPAANWHRFDPVAPRDPLRAATQQLFGRPLDVHLRLEDADAIVALDADPLGSDPSWVRHARAFAARRRAESGHRAPNRLYAIESTPSITGTNADLRLAIAADRIGDVAHALAARVAGGGVPGALGVRPDPAEEHALDTIARDLAAHRGRSIVVAGPWQPPEVHALVLVLNSVLGNLGRTVVFTRPVEPAPSRPAGDLVSLVRDMESGRVDTLLVLGGNPAFTAPADVPFVRAMDRVALRVHFGPYEDETSALCHWHVNAAHALESWSDARAADGTLSVVQPLVDPLYGGRTPHELLAACLGETGRSARDLVVAHWRERFPRPDFESFWRRALHDGFVAGSAEPPVDAGAPADLAPRAVTGTANAGRPWQLVFRPDYATWDGRYANNAWLQELPRPLTTLTWDNALLVAPADARELGVANGDVVELAVGPRRAAVPVLLLPGQARGVLAVHLGYGRRRAGRAGTGTGVDVYALREVERAWTIGGVGVRRTGDTHRLALTQGHFTMEGRDQVRAAALGEYRQVPDFATRGREVPARDESLFPAVPPDKTYAWSMAIDLGACIGCSACVVACQAENNIPVVGRSEVLRGREMQWIRIDRYYEGEPDAPRALFQPVTCMHCETAPCELVCPVAATNHSSEGLNQQVYNRCIGTRYCSNNCPYKVRRFNFLQYTDYRHPSLALGRNPDVSVRSRGVMEKCTYCVQRIQEAKIRAEKEDRTVRDGEIVPACAQACPANAIVFGNLLERGSRVDELRSHPLRYDLLAELNTRPRTFYLARVTNPPATGGQG